MLKYLTRYLTGGPISNQRIIEERDGQVWFWVRSKKKGAPSEPYSLSAVSFVQQWSLHIVPKQLTKSRRFGAWSGSQCKSYQELCEQLAPASEVAVEAPSQPAEQKKEPKERVHKCPKCEAPMVCIEKQHRPKWRELFYGPDHPSWYEWTSRGLCVPL